MSLPPFLKPGEKVVLYDGICKLCNGWVKFLLRRKLSHRIRFAAVQSEEGKALLRFAGLPDENIRTIVLIDGDRHWIRAQAILRVMRLMPFPWGLISLLRFIIPDFISNYFYNRIAVNRYRLFGCYEAQLPVTADYPGRFLHS
ncbi:MULTISPECIES: thiol-disulfide oxidoreductase DCC family protein [Pantoea]|uniref:thiol-disulfide oxidoreductase DCC family protein n=1 Tax=Pantoea TaxID=53335 RepID=UPI002892A440|nr:MULTISPECIES: thiol-disulfide oxidoreductase DCC family protein [unclassified Pantoea]MCG7387093.1 thiol-disulfide oxidoreductase DCC family protein [Pantoea sp. ACRSB]